VAVDRAGLRRWAEALDLGGYRWRVLPRHSDHFVATGWRNREPIWVLKAELAAEGVSRLDREVAGEAALNAALGANAGDLIMPRDVRASRRAEVAGVALLVVPFVQGKEIAPEKHLGSRGVRRLEGCGQLVERLLESLQSLPLTGINALDADTYRAWISARLDQRLHRLVATDGLEPKAAELVARRFDGLLARASLRQSFTHGDLTPWHMVEVARDRVVLLDLEHCVKPSPAGVDMSTLVMRLWAVNGARELAQALAASSPKRLLLEPEELDWQWLYAAVRARDESATWLRRDLALSFYHAFVRRLTS
jgi:phosphotransferase family enzyme